MEMSITFMLMFGLAMLFLIIAGLWLAPIPTLICIVLAIFFDLNMLVLVGIFFVLLFITSGKYRKRVKQGIKFKTK